MDIVFILLDNEVTDPTYTLYLLDRLNIILNDIIYEKGINNLVVYFNRLAVNSNITRFLIEKGVEVSPLYIKKSLRGMVNYNLPKAPCIHSLTTILIESKGNRQSYRELKEDILRYPSINNVDIKIKV